MSIFHTLTKKGMRAGRSFNLIEIILFESYLVVAGLFIYYIFPVLGNIHIIVYLIVLFLGIAYTLREYIVKNKNFEKRWKMKKWHIRLLKQFSYLDFAIYKSTVFIFGIILGILFPSIISGEIIIFWALLFGTGLGYFVARIVQSSEK